MRENSMAIAVRQILKRISSCLPFCDLDQGCVAIEKHSKNVSSSEEIEQEQEFFIKNLIIDQDSVPIGKHSKNVSSSEEMVQEQGFFTEDLVIEILSRLPVGSINNFKFVSKQWLKICLRPSFGYSHFDKSARSTSGVFIQGNFGFISYGAYVDTKHLDYISLSNEGTRASVTTALDFLPEKVVVLASGNGVILCRNIFEVEGGSHCNDRGDKFDPQEVRLYVCNPFIKEWRTLKPRGRYRNGCCYGFSYNVFFGRADFQVVMVEPPRELGKDPYQFTIYSSKTGMWKISSERCHLPDRLLMTHISYFADGVYYWLTTQHTILAFDLEQERSQVIKLPGQKLIGTEGLGLCLGVSEGRLHHVSFNMVDLSVWALEYENLSPKWVLKHFKPILEMNNPVVANWGSLHVRPKCLMKYWKNLHTKPNIFMLPLSLRDDILFLNISLNESISTYNIKTGEIDEICSLSALNKSAHYSPTVLPYAKSLLHVNGGD